MEKRTRIESGMRAEIRAENGEIYSGTINNIEKELEVTPHTISWEEVQEKGWESRKWEAAVAAMQGMLADGVREANTVTCKALMYADALVKKFREEEECQG